MSNTKVGAAANYLDERVGASKAVRGLARKLFPDHWSFLLGEVALYSFIVLIISGTFLTMFFVPSMAPIEYTGPYEPLQGQMVSEAFNSTMELSFEVRGGLLMRQMHHWAALIFVAAATVHMLRVFFTGAFRKPRELNWLVGFGLLTLGLLAGFSGYSLPDDVLSGNGLRIADGVARSIPLIGSYASFALFGGEFPGTELIPRLFTVHVLIVPGLILALVSVHLILVVVHKHTQFPGSGRTNKNVRGMPVFPVYAAKAGGFFFIVFGFIALMGATLSINPVWAHGGYDPSPIGAGAQPDWYMLFLEGGLRLMPGVEWVIGGFTISPNILVPGVLIPGLMFTLAALYPFLEAWVTKDKREHHVLDRPRNAPVRTALGTMSIMFYVIIVLAGANDILATHFDLSINAVTQFFRGALLIAPPLTFYVTKRICLGLQRRDRDLVLYGHESGRIVRSADGQYAEVHRPLDEHETWLRVNYVVHRPLEIEPAEDERGVRRPGYRADKLRQRVSRFFFEERVEPPTPAEVAAASQTVISEQVEGAADGSAIEAEEKAEAPITAE